MTAGEHRRRFELFGTSVELMIGRPSRAGMLSPQVVAVQIEAWMRGVHRELTRFDADSGLSVLNADPSPARAVSGLLAETVAAGIAAAERSGGLVDPTLAGEIEAAGYTGSRTGEAPAPLAEALAAAPERAPARPRQPGDWRRVEVDLERGVVSRPPGVRFDAGGIAKGLVADLAAAMLSGYSSFAIDAGGDIRIGGSDAERRPRRVEVDHPLRSAPAHIFEICEGAVATSGLGTRIWRHRGAFAHHILDPSTGGPAWTGVVQATAIAATAVEAEALAKAALLSGPQGCGDFLAERGGVAVLDDGEVALHGPVGSSEVAA